MGTKVTLRHKPITNGRESLYLDFYPPIRCKATMKLVHKEYLGIYIYQNPQNEIQRDYNREMLYKAEAIRSVRVQSCINEEFGFLDKHKLKADFLDFFRSIALKKDPKWRMVYKHFEKFCGGKCSFGEVTVDLCRRFRDYLMTTRQLKFTNKKMKCNSAAGYFSTFRALLKIAYRDKLIRENVNDFLEKMDAEDRDIFVRRYWFFDSIAAIAKRHAMSVGSVKMNLYRSRKKLLKVLKKEGKHL